MRKILFVANVAKEHVLKFHVPTIKCFREHGWTVDVACAGEESIPYCNIQYKACWKRTPFTFDTFKGIRQLKKIIDEGEYDIVYCHTPVGGLVARLASRRARKNKGTKVIYFAHGLHFFKGAPLLNWLLYLPVEKYLARLTDLILTNNDEDYKNIKKLLNSKIKVLQFPEVGVSFERLTVGDKEQVRIKYRDLLAIPPKATVLIYVAELIKNKNQIMLLNALLEIHKEFPQTFLLLVGPDHYNGYYQKRARTMGLEDNVKFLGWRNDIGELLVSSDICVASSIREGFGLNLVEAMYCGLPVVASLNRGHSSIIKDGENGFLVPVNDYVLMAKRIIEIVKDSQLRKEISGIDVSKYDSKAIANVLYEAISSL